MDLNTKKEYDLYNDIQLRCGGEIYIGVVGPVRTGKSTFIKRFMDLCLCALRFMDLRRYTGIGIVSPAECQIQPEILAEAKAGEIDETLVPEPEKRKRILDLLDRKSVV